MRSVILSGGRSCFVACHGCYNHFARDLIDTPTVLRFVRGLRDRFGLDKITVGGGDPLTRPDITDLLAGIRDAGLQISLDTVGTAFLGDAKIRFMGRGTAVQVSAAKVTDLVDVLGIPLDGSTDDVMRRFRAHSSVTDQKAILSLLDAHRARVCINTVVHSGNTHDMANIAEIIAEHRSVRQWQLFQYMPIGPLGWRSRASFTLGESPFRTAAQTAFATAPAGVEVIAKSASNRKNRYLLIDTAGVIWIPDQSPQVAWSDFDTNGHRQLIGRIDEPGILGRLEVIDRQPVASRP
jgi:molybdenum cofactor biosynthesis enzyme MoaA